MKILHTADWHLGDRLGRIDRTADIQRAVERVGRYCYQEKIDLLLVAGDLFSELSRPEGLRQSIQHFQQVFEEFLLAGGTILALTGNHDNENFCQTLRHALSLAAPEPRQSGGVLRCGRFYLATEPTLCRVADRSGAPVQFVLMPYPTPSRYFDENSPRYNGLEEKNQALQESFNRKLRDLLAAPAYDPTKPAVLAAHIHVHGARLPNLFRMSEAESMVFADSDLPAELAYVALGHIHQPQSVGGVAHVRYSGSIERLDLGERYDQKGVTVVEIGPEGRRNLAELPLEATPMFDVEITSPQVELELLAEKYPDADQALVRYRLRYTAGTDNLETLLRRLDDIFPRWYERSWVEAGELGGARTTAEVVAPHKSFHDTVFDYLDGELADHPDREALRRLAEELLAEEAG